LPGYPGVSNPFGIEEYPMVARALAGVVVLLPVCILASAASLVFRYRRSSPKARRQIKWVACAASFVGVVYLSILISALLFAPEALATEQAPLWLAHLQNIGLMSYACVAVAVGFAVLKYRLYDIDVVINRTVVYGPLTATLAAVYFGGVATIQSIFRVLTG
jgi:hypothetical protein